MKSFEPARRVLWSEWDAQGLPTNRPVADWADLLEQFVTLETFETLKKGAIDGDRSDRLREFARHCLRLCRPDGGPMFGEGSKKLFGPLHDWAEQVGDEGIQTVLDRWSPPKDREPIIAPPPLPAFAGEKQSLAILRPGWSARGDWIAVDQRNADAPCLVELAGAGKIWIGPHWGVATNSQSRVSQWSTDSRVDLFEWSFQENAGTVVRSALLARGRGWGILSEERPPGETGTAELRLDLASKVLVDRSTENAALSLSNDRRRAILAPIGLENGTFGVKEGRLSLDQVSKGRRAWLPILAVWNPDLLGKKLRWKRLTVAENGAICPPDAAFAARVSWGISESIVVYRSLARPALRTFLGHQTGSRFLVGLFHKEDGRVEPLVNVE